MSGSAQMINARSETAATKPAFRDALASRRCLVPADGFYEWMRTGKAKQPYCFEVNDGELFAFAGLWERWKDPSGQWVKSCSILTTTPNAVTSAVHDRMPVILDHDSYDLWLDPGMKNIDALSEMLKPYDAREMRSYPVSNRVNHVADDDAELLDTGRARRASAGPVVFLRTVMPQHAKKREAPKTPPATLKGWQQIAAFLGEPPSVVQRWASDGMPVRKQGRYVETTPNELNAWLGKESGKPVHVATENTDLTAELKRGLSFIRNEKPSKKTRKARP